MMSRIEIDNHSLSLRKDLSLVKTGGGVYFDG